MSKIKFIEQNKTETHNNSSNSSNHRLVTQHDEHESSDLMQPKQETRILSPKKEEL